MLFCRDNQHELAESTDRGPIDYAHFALDFAGIIFIAAGVVTLSIGLCLLGAVLLALGLAYFWMDN